MGIEKEHEGNMILIRTQERELEKRNEILCDFLRAEKNRQQRIRNQPPPPFFGKILTKHSSDLFSNSISKI